ncbi:hypothetical protein QPK24_12280 [Paenibacillus polygoni]|uniref:Lipoprotein n=1 Tax=Paenibacillus polygoni TaxID=3050112 RepID=A0ABY8WYK4_9BACL|nr:hypothetical protein [Paenibacillus polygoni]WIV17232.1 hypothetical protein QPK24_12280 [Paenibacillus polygoni]
MKKVISLLALSLILLLSGCTDNGYKSIEATIRSEGIQNKQILYKQELNHSTILIYENPNGGVDAGIVYKVGNKYKWSFGGGVSLLSNETDVTWSWVNLNAKEEETQYQFYIGIVREQSISRLHIKSVGMSKNVDKYAEIVELRDGTKLWFALQDKYSNVQPGFILNGFDKDGKRIFHYEAEQSIN